jgi:uncharacterized membrane protein
LVETNLQGIAMSRWLIIMGIVLVVLGLAWPLIAKLGLGNLPGDIRVEREGFSFYFPITSGIIVSIVLSLIVMLVDWIFRK